MNCRGKWFAGSCPTKGEAKNGIDNDIAVRAVLGGNFVEDWDIHVFALLDEVEEVSFAGGLRVDDGGVKAKVDKMTSCDETVTAVVSWSSMENLSIMQLK